MIRTRLGVECIKVVNLQLALVNNTQQIHFKGVTLHLSARIIVSSPASVEIE
jgi:hypothetical protein